MSKKFPLWLSILLGGLIVILVVLLNALFVSNSAVTDVAFNVYSMDSSLEGSFELGSAESVYFSSPDEQKQFFLSADIEDSPMFLIVDGRVWQSLGEDTQIRNLGFTAYEFHLCHPHPAISFGPSSDPLKFPEIDDNSRFYCPNEALEHWRGNVQE